MRKFIIGAALMLCVSALVSVSVSAQDAAQSVVSQGAVVQDAAPQSEISAAEVKVLPKPFPTPAPQGELPLVLELPQPYNDIYLKLNALYAMAGVINPSVEFGLSRHSTFQTELVFSPWSSIEDNGVGKPMLFGIFTNEYRYYPKMQNDGWYFGLSAGVMAFNMTKPSRHGDFWLKDNSSKGYGFLFSAVGGYEWQFGRDKRWLLDASIAFGYTQMAYNGYALIDGIVDGGHTYNKGEIIMTPHRSVQPSEPDPWNKSAQWIPTRVAVSMGYKIFDPAKRTSVIWRDPSGGGPMWMR